MPEECSPCFQIPIPLPCLCCPEKGSTNKRGHFESPQAAVSSNNNSTGGGLRVNCPAAGDVDGLEKLQDIPIEYYNVSALFPCPFLVVVQLLSFRPSSGGRFVANGAQWERCIMHGFAYRMHLSSPLPSTAHT